MTSTTTLTNEETIALARKNLHRAPKEVRDAFHILDGAYQNRPAEYAGTPVTVTRADNEHQPLTDDVDTVTRAQALQTVMEAHHLMDAADIDSRTSRNGPTLSLLDRVKGLLYNKRELQAALVDRQKRLDEALRDLDDAAVAAKTKLAEHFDAVQSTLDARHQLAVFRDEAHQMDMVLNDAGFQRGPSDTLLERVARITTVLKEREKALLVAGVVSAPARVDSPTQPGFGRGDSTTCVSQAIQTLLDREKQITLVEYRELLMNSWEHEAVLLRLTDEALIEATRHTLKNCRVPHKVRPCSVYDDALSVVIVPELLRRLAAKDSAVSRADAAQAQELLLEDPHLGFSDPPAMVIEKYIDRLFSHPPILDAVATVRRAP